MPVDLEAMIRKSYEALNRRDVEMLLEDTDPEIEFVSVTARIEGEGGVMRGHEAIGEWVAMMTDIWEEAHWELKSVDQIDDHRALATVGGKGVRVEGYPSAPEARAAVGLD